MGSYRSQSMCARANVFFRTSSVTESGKEALEVGGGVWKRAQSIRIVGNEVRYQTLGRPRHQPKTDHTKPYPPAVAKVPTDPRDKSGSTRAGRNLNLIPPDNRVTGALILALFHSPPVVLSRVQILKQLVFSRWILLHSSPSPQDPSLSVEMGL